MVGRSGADDLNGGEGNDTASYAHSPGGVTVDSTLTGGDGADTFIFGEESILVDKTR